MHIVSLLMLGSVGAYATLDHVPRRDEDMWWRNPLAVLGAPTYILDKVGEKFLPSNMSRSAKYVSLGVGCALAADILLRRKDR